MLHVWGMWSTFEPSSHALDLYTSRERVGENGHF
jgi:hypothetical protein